MNLLLGDSFILEFPEWFSVKNPSAVKETQKRQVRSLGQEDPLEEEMATHSGSLAWKIPRTEEPGALQCMWSQSQTQLSTHTCIHSKPKKNTSLSLYNHLGKENVQHLYKSLSSHTNVYNFHSFVSVCLNWISAKL